MIVAGCAALLLVSLSAIPSERIGAPFAGAAGRADVLAGVLFWAGLTLLASGVSAELPEGTRLVWVLAPLVATMNLGGPFVAAWVAALATTELRELRGGVPWYGVLNNHAGFALAAVLGAGTMALLRSLLSAISGGPLGDLLATFLGGCVFEGTNIALALLIVRTGRWRVVLASLATRSFVAADAAQLAVGWLMAATYLLIGWWAPLVFVLPALLAWQAFDRDRLSWAAGHDALTDLPNRRGLDARVSAAVEAARSGSPGVLLVVDLDGFKDVNDRLGHDAGDTVLQVVGRRLLSATRSGDHVVRLGGDEFAVLLVGLGPSVAGPVVERLHETLTQPIALDRANVTVGASIGVATIDGTCADPDELLRLADRAMFDVKWAQRAGAT